MFQSSPTPKGGRYNAILMLYTLDRGTVSILAHPERWALLRTRVTDGCHIDFA